MEAREESNHRSRWAVEEESVGAVGSARLWRVSSTSGQGVRAQSGEGREVLKEGIESKVSTAVWSEPVGGRSLRHRSTIGRRREFAKA